MTKPVALVTGGARRIGATICQQLHSAGYRVLVHYRSSANAAEALTDALNRQYGSSAHALQADLMLDEEVQRLAQEALAVWGRLDLLVNNASSFYATPFGETTLQQWDDLISSNLKAPFFLSQALSPALKAQQGCIVNITDIHGQRPLANHAVYSIAKAGNRMLTQSLALELAPDIRVNGIAPGAILWPEVDDLPQQDVAMLQKIPLHKLGGAEAIASAVLYLAEKDSYVTGHILTVDGGRSLQQ